MRHHERRRYDYTSSPWDRPKPFRFRPLIGGKRKMKGEEWLLLAIVTVVGFGIILFTAAIGK